MRVAGGSARPMKYGLNGTMPALVKSSVGSPCGTSDALGMRVCPFAFMNSTNVWRISSDFMRGSLEVDAGRAKAGVTAVR